MSGATSNLAAATWLLLPTPLPTSQLSSSVLSGKHLFLLVTIKAKLVSPIQCSSFQLHTILYLVTRVTKGFKSHTKVLISKQKANIDIIMKIDALEFRFDNYARYEENIYLQLYIIKTLNH